MKEEKERNTDWLPSTCAPTWDRTHYLGMCCEGESTPQPFGVRDEAPTN